MRQGLIDQITTPASQNLLEPGVAWCADNGIYSRAYPGDLQYLGWLSSLPDPGRCAFAVAPDVVADHTGTWQRSWPMLRRIRDLGLPVAMCAQNGATPDDMPWDHIDAVFLAGILECVRCDYVPPIDQLGDLAGRCPNGHVMREWKTSPAAAAVTTEARARGKWVHMGRVNSLRRLRHAADMGCDSADGTFLAFGPDINLARLLGWFDELAARPSLFQFMYAEGA
jgi:hypothetical protein